LISGKNILISPLDWGLGHATRVAPLIKSLAENNKIIIGVTTSNAFFFNEYFPELQRVELPSYSVVYSKNFPAWLSVILQTPKLRRIIKEENKKLKEIIVDYKINFVISDNRFGLYNKNVECIFITHQVKIVSPFFSSFATKINRKCIHHFNEVWIPDYEEKNLRLSGKLSDSEELRIPVKYIGPQSFLNLTAVPETKNEKVDYLILLSGPEPQRSVIEKMLIETLRESTRKIVMVRGSEIPIKENSGAISIIDKIFGQELANLIVNSENVICRSGYSTLMDMHSLKKNQLILIPTPGQPEQEYLGNYWKEKFGAIKISQNNIKEEITKLFMD
jgi:uncharacterized protein (TIGR00661 family)